MLSAQRGKNGEPQPAPVAVSHEDAASKRDLTSWWRQFKRGTAKREEEKAEPLNTIFGVPLLTSVRYANVAISLYDQDGKSYIYGYVPIIVAKCGVFLKEKATEIEGIFRLSGSEKRIKELRAVFDSQETRFGKGLDWSGFTVHDAANILRRYFNTLPEPIIPLQYYEQFRNPIRGHQAQAVGEIDGQGPIVGDFDPDAAIKRLKNLVTEIPPLNRQLLLYILDLLAVFAAKSDVNKMTTANLAAIFQPGILSHPNHAMAPPEYRLSQDVLIFLINNQDHFLIGMQGTAADEKTVQDVQNGPPKQASTPPRKSGVSRSASNASAGAESLRKFGGIRRNVSVSSRNSRGSVVAPQSPATPSHATSPTIGVHRSNTVPSKKSPAVGIARFARPGEKRSEPPTPTSTGTSSTAQAVSLLSTEPSKSPAPAQVPVLAHVDVPATAAVPLATSEVAAPPIEDTTPRAEQPQVNPIESVQLSENEKITQKTAAPTVESSGCVTSEQIPATIREEESAGGTTPTAPASGSSRTLTQMFSRNLAYEQSEKGKDIRRPNKLQKKRGPSSANLSAHSSTQSLTGVISNDTPLSPVLLGSSTTLQGSTKEAFPTSMIDSNQAPGVTLMRPALSPSPSHRSYSTSNDLSEAEHGDETPGAGTAVEPDKKHRWRLSNHQNKHESKPGDLGSNAGAQQSMSSFTSSAGGRGRKSFEPITQWGSESSASTGQRGLDAEIGSPPKEHRGLGGWLKAKLGDKKDRAKSPPESQGQRQQLQGTDAPSRGKSMEVARRDSDQTVETITRPPTAEKAGATAAAVAAAQTYPSAMQASNKMPAGPVSATTQSVDSAAAKPTTTQDTFPKVEG
ncbi:RhoGAP-domain-containing protein [Pseudovirgaria hyperparasitica]|uniref:RhoGAP-domain-containing protein n=1 Tax=Pseudovirgaria hyperparasitica TaxID=470096 RepID=A0A6A6WIC1_9PEZI|nr:RhoGAP-domain-containing protein [Pseudovirgaria hyperparasitica]KAF2762543.1 RhoGAP-domain-containing protein [Pseudovirgaria hyperparasitica]